MLHTAVRNLKGQEGEGEGGFTLIELLVVILIIGILAAIALPTFLGQSNKAKDSSAKSDARNAVSQVESCLADGNKTASECVDKTENTDLQQFGASLTGSAPGAIAGISSVYELSVVSETGNRFGIVKQTSGGFLRRCSVQGGKEGAGCSATGAGVASW